MKQYSRKGFPGAIDVTHMLWDGVSAAKAIDHAEERKPALGFPRSSWISCGVFCQHRWLCWSRKHDYLAK